jgi:hypothetical protein
MDIRRGTRVKVISQRHDLDSDDAHPGDTGVVIDVEQSGTPFVVLIDRTRDEWWFDRTDLEVVQP